MRIEDTLNIKILLNTISIKHKAAFNEFIDFSSSEKVDFSVINDFITKYKIFYNCEKTITIKPNYQGTFSYTVSFDKKIQKQINSKSNKFSYYYLKSIESAYEKAILKCFQIINLIITNKKFY